MYVINVPRDLRLSGSSRDELVGQFVSHDDAPGGPGAPHQSRQPACVAESEIRRSVGSSGTLASRAARATLHIAAAPEEPD